MQENSTSSFLTVLPSTQWEQAQLLSVVEFATQGAPAEQSHDVAEKNL